MEQQRLKAITLPSASLASLTALKVEVGTKIRNGTLLAEYSVNEQGGNARVLHLRSSVVGIVRSVHFNDGDTIPSSAPLVSVEEVCEHSIVVFDMCADCGLNLRRTTTDPSDYPHSISANVSMIHGIPELRVSQEEAEKFGNEDRLRLLTNRKLALIVDLDQTLVHTSMDSNIQPGLPDVYGFHLPDHHLLYHCRLRPHTRQFLDKAAKLFELHVFTMGTKSYAASVTQILDPERKLFSDRIISRDECFDPRSKALRLKSVFPCGDSMVAIIDDREDVWGRSPNLVHVKPYVFFSGTKDINAPPPRPSRPRPSHAPRVTHGDKDRNAPIPSKAHHYPMTRRGDVGSSGTGPGRGIRMEHGKVELPRENFKSDGVSGKMSSESEITVRSKVSSDSDGISANVETVPGGDNLISSTNSNNNNNNNNQSNEEEEEEEEGAGAEGSAASSSSDSSDDGSTSSSSGIDDSLFDQSPNVGGEMQQEEPLKNDMATPTPGEGVKEADTDQGDLSPLTSEVSNSAPPSSGSVITSPTHPSKIEDTDDFLIHLIDILTRIYETFYEQFDAMTHDIDITKTTAFPVPDLKQIIPKLRHSILKDCRILFTGVIPTNMPVKKNPAWNTARAFGATIHETLVPGLDSSSEGEVAGATTHVISGKPGTSKLIKAEKLPGIKIVTPKWLWACAERWKRVDEGLYLADLGKKRDTKVNMRPPESKIQRVDGENVPNPSAEHEMDTLEEKPQAGDDDSSDSDDEIFRDQSMLVAKMDTTELKRHMSRESRLSVSDDELERMVAEVDAEISSSNSSNGSTSDINIEREGLGSVVEHLVEDNDELSYDKFVGLHETEEADVLERLSRKRRFLEVDTQSSSSDSQVIEQCLNDSFVSDEDDPCENDSNDDDELGALLGYS